MIKIGFLHIGMKQKTESGVTRHGRFLANATKSIRNATVIEFEIMFEKNDCVNNQAILKQAAEYLSEADIVHLQYCKHIWGGAWEQLQGLRLFFQNCNKPIVVTCHDIYPSLYAPVIEAIKNLILMKSVRFIKDYIPDNLTMSWLSKKAELIIFCSQEENKRVSHLVARAKVKIIPLFVEDRKVNYTMVDARSSLGLSQTAIILTLQGFIYGSKGHKILIDAISLLPDEIQVIFAGGGVPGYENFVEYLQKLAKSLKVDHRLLITGYLSYSDLEKYLVASDLAICPFVQLSASASLSTWISLGVPILASDVPQISEYNDLVPSSIQTFQPYTPEALAKAIIDLLPKTNIYREKVAQLREMLLIPKIVESHLKCYEAIIKNMN